MLLVAAPCWAAPNPDPTAVYQSICAEFDSERLDDARQRASQARQEYTVASAGATWGLKFRLLEAEIVLRQGHYEDAIGLLKSAGTFPASGDLAIKRNLILSRAHNHLGRMQESNRELHVARRLAESENSSLIGEVLHAEAQVQRDAGHWNDALHAFDASLAIARAHDAGWLVAADLVDLGDLHLESGHYDKALQFSREAEAAARSIQANTQIDLALGNMGWAYVNLGEFELGLNSLKAADRLAQEIGQISYRVNWLEDAGVAEYCLRNLAEARGFEEQALGLAATLPSAEANDDLVNIYTNLALLSYKDGRYDAAKDYSDQALRLSRSSANRQIIAYPVFLEGLIVAHQARNGEAGRLLKRAHDLTTDSGTRTEIENALAHFHEDRQEIPQAEAWYRRSIDSFEHNRSMVKTEALRLSSFAYGDQIYRDYAEFLIARGRAATALEILDRSRARTLEEGLSVAPEQVHSREHQALDIRATARKLGSPILFYSLGDKDSYLWAITVTGTQLFRLPKRSDIETLVRGYQATIQKSIDPLQTQDAAARSLYSALIEPAASLIPDGAHVYVVPDGVLHGLNFETLVKPAGSGLKFWIEDVTVTITSSIRLLASQPATAPDAASRNILLIGDPVVASPEFGALPNALAEIERVQGHFAPGERTVLTLARAVPSAYAASAPDRFQYIHFVAHGIASRSSPLDSAVVLSPTETHPEDFKLYARDIVQRPLHARLVTISACYGSGLRTYAGEGMVGLAWAFLRAGSHNVISALWEVNDSSTPLLMDRLYAEITSGKAPDAALRDAKLSLLHSSGVYRKPFYWAAFQLYAGS
jgi:CHAT domain-containing protein